MLSYAFKDLQLKKRNNVDAEDFNNIHNLFASILAKELSQNNM